MVDGAGRVLAVCTTPGVLLTEKLLLCLPLGQPYHHRQKIQQQQMVIPMIKKTPSITL